MHHNSTCNGLMFVMSVMLTSVMATGCGVGYRYGTADLSYSPDPTSLAKSSPTNKQPFVVATNYHEFRLIDTTGLLLAGMTNVGRQTVARQDALDSAKNKRDTNGDGRVEVEYGYKPVGIYPGSRVVVDLRLGTGPQLTFDGLDEPFPNTALTYWGADIMGEFYQMDATWLKDLRATLFFALHMENIGYEDNGSLDFDAFGIDMTFGSNLGYHIGGVTLVATAGVGVLTPVFKALVDSPETHYLNGTLALEALYYPLEWLGLSANVSVLRGFSSGRNMVVSRGGIGIVLEYDPGEF